MERITARKNPLLQQVRRLISSRKEREETGLFVADGTDTMVADFENLSLTDPALTRNESFLQKCQ